MLKTLKLLYWAGLSLGLIMIALPHPGKLDRLVILALVLVSLIMTVVFSSLGERLSPVGLSAFPGDRNASCVRGRLGR